MMELRRRLALNVLLALGIADHAPSLAGPEVYTADRPGPEILERFELPIELTAFDVSPDGRRAAVALPDPGRALGSLLLLYSLESAQPSTVTLAGQSRDLLFSPDGNGLLAVQHRPGKRSRDGETVLLRIEIPDLRWREVMPLPTSARGLAFRESAGSVLIACHDEIRSIRVPELRSGPLYRIPGHNLSIAVVDGSRILIGQDAALLLVDLADPPGPEQMPVRATVASSSPLLDLAVSADGERGLARASDERIFRIDLDPPRMEAIGRGLLLDRPSSRDTASSRRAVEPRVEAPSVPGPPAPVPPSPVPPSPSLPPSLPPAEVGKTLPLPEPVHATDDGAPKIVAPPTARPSPANPAGEETPALRGRITGPGAGLVRSVVLFGPDNILREAARISVPADGRWSVADLPPGRYRVLLDGDAGRVLITDPRFATVELDRRPRSSPTVDFRVLRAM